MIPAAFDYTRATSIEEAIAAVGGGAKVLAGGQSILPLLKLRLASAERLVDIGRIAGLKGYRTLPDGGVEIGALTTYAEWQAATTMPSVAAAIELIADVQVRNRGTVGGSIAHADPASDLPAIALAFDGSAVLRGPAGERVVPLDQFFLGAFETAMAPDEILVAIRRPPVPAGAGFAYRKLAQPASGYSIVGVAAVIGRGGDGRIDHARVALTGVHEHAYRAPEVEAALVGSDGGEAAVESAARHATADVEVNSDIHADAAYRAAMAVVYTKRAIEGALGR
ncbi:MAG TPA: xanthine dehydrogenase family protein subunit M [Candidatus Limnocylindrales bacterium]|nr:xanthine dehydrogenase family protein subunit M [Candidatus Limnocylindrales bacterium]